MDLAASFSPEVLRTELASYMVWAVNLVFKKSVIINKVKTAFDTVFMIRLGNLVANQVIFRFEETPAALKSARHRKLS